MRAPATRALLLAATAAALVGSGGAQAATFNVLPGRASLPSAAAPNAPGEVAFPADLLAPPAKPPRLAYDELLSLWQHAAMRYGVPWEVLAAINEVESGLGANMGPSSANAVGWMQFLPSTWEAWGVDGDGDGVADPWNPTDAVYAAARYLAAAGGRDDIYRAVYAYNHAGWYVERVLGLAGEYLADPLRGRTLLAGVPGAVVLDGPTVQQRLAEARAELAALERRAVALQAAMARTDGALERASLASGNPSLSERAFRRLRRRVRALSLVQAARQARLERLLQDAERTKGDIQVLEQNALLADQRALAAGGLEGLIGTPPTPAVGAVIDYAVRQLGVPYHWGGNHGYSLEQMETADPDPAAGFDCSSLIAWAYAKGAGIYVGDYTGSQWELGATAPGAIRGAGPAQGGGPPPGGYLPGDLLFFNDTDHVGMYLGNDLFIHAPHTGDVVRIARLSAYPLPVWGWVRYEQLTGIPFVAGVAGAPTAAAPVFSVVARSAQPAPAAAPGGELRQPAAFGAPAPDPFAPSGGAEERIVTFTR